MLPTIDLQDDVIVMVDQRKLPAQEVYIRCRTAPEVAKAIRTMVIRGAPAIGVAAAYGLALGMRGRRARLVDVALADALLRRRRQAGAEPASPTREELLALAAALREFDRGVIEVAPQHDHRLDRRQARRAGVLRRAGARERQDRRLGAAAAHPFVPGQARRAASTRPRRLQASGVQVVPQVGCRPLELRFDFATPGFGLDNNPFWRPIMAKPREERRRLFADPAFRDELRGMRAAFVAALARGWDRLVLRLPAADAHRGAGRTAASPRSPRERGATPLDAFCDAVLDDDLAGPVGRPR